MNIKNIIMPKPQASAWGDKKGKNKLDFSPEVY